MKKVFHIITTDVYSGAENVACQIIKCFETENNYEMFYVSKIGSNQKKLEELNIKCIKLKKMNYFTLKKIINSEKPDILHAHDAKACVLATMVKTRHIKIIGHIHGNHENMRKLTIKSLLLKIVARKISKIIWVTEDSLNDYYFTQNVKEKSCIIENVVNPIKILNEISRDSNEYIHYDLIFLGRLSYPKNPLRLIDVIEKVSREKPNIKIAIVGSGEMDELIKKEINQRGLTDIIDLFGYVCNPYKILASSSIMIMTSRYEGVPMSALESFALGKPIVSTPTDGLTKIISNNVDGFLSDDNDELAKKICFLLSNKEIYERFSKNALKKSNTLNNLSKYKEKMKNLYEEVNK